MLLDNSTITAYMNKRVLSMFIDYFLFLLIFIPTFILLMEYNESYFYRLFIVFLYPLIVVIGYYVIFVRITNGSTLGGLIMGLKIIRLKGKISTMIYLKRCLYAIFVPFKLLTLDSFKVNSLGQLYYDEKFNTIVIDRKNLNNLSKENDIKYFEYTYALKALKLFGGVWLLFFVYFLLQKIINIIT